VSENNGDSYRIIRDSTTLRILFFTLMGFVLIGLFYIFRPYIWVFIFSVIVYIGVFPIYEWIRKKLKSEGIAVLIVGIGVFLLIVVPSILMLIYLGDQTWQLYTYVMDKVDHGILNRLRSYSAVEKIFSFLNIDEQALITQVTGFIKTSAGSLLSNITSLISYPVFFVANLFFMVLMLILLLKKGHDLEETFYGVLPFPDDLERKVVERLKSVIKILLAGNLFIMSLQGFFIGLGLFLAGFSAPLFWGIVGSVVSLIPLIGTGFIWIPTAIYLVILGQYGWAVFIIVWSYGWYLFFENLIKPWAFGDRLNFNPLLFFFLLLGSVQGFGLAGVIIGPLLLTLFFSLWEIYRIVQHRMPSSEDKPESEKADVS
jgi:predicted PurR-regulated permease PerM